MWISIFLGGALFPQFVLPGFFRLDGGALQAHIAAVQINQTIGHSDAVMALGLNRPERNNDGSNQKNDVRTPTDDEQEDGDETTRNYMINSGELSEALQKALVIASQSQVEIQKAGWKLVHQGDVFSLYKRRVKRINGDGPGPVEYLMTGNLPDVSPRTFLHAQLSKHCRQQWDKTMKDMSVGDVSKMEEGGKESEDILYYRTKWPWPLKDRDYTLARRTKYFPKHNAIMLVSKSTEECTDHPREDGVIRVDNYWCHSAILSTRSSSPSTSDHTDGSHDTDTRRSESNEDSNQDGKNENNNQSSEDPNQENTSSGSQQQPPPYHHQSKSKFPMIARSPAEQKVMQERRKKLEDRAKQNWKKFGSRFRIPNAKAPRRRNDHEDNERHPNRDNNDHDSHAEEHDTIHSSSSSSSSSHVAAVDLPGTSFITLFCDDQKVPLPPTIVDILSKQGEKLVPDSISSLHEVARGVEQERQSQRAQTTNTPTEEVPMSSPPLLHNPMTKNQNYQIPSTKSRHRRQEVRVQEGVGMDGKLPQQPVGISATVQRLKRKQKITIPVVTTRNSGTTPPVSVSASDISSSVNADGTSPSAGTNDNHGDGSSSGISTRMEDVIKYPLSGAASPPF